jgi:hypothetical protein
MAFPWELMLTVSGFKVAECELLEAGLGVLGG